MKTVFTILLLIVLSFFAGRMVALKYGITRTGVNLDKSEALLLSTTKVNLKSIKILNEASKLKKEFIKRMHKRAKESYLLKECILNLNKEGVDGI